MVNAPDVSIDLSGFRIDGGGRAFSGIRGAKSNLTVKNGTISSFRSHGISIWLDGLTVDRMWIRNNGGNGVAAEAEADETRVTNSTIVRNDGAGVHCFYSCHIEGNIINENGMEAGRSGVEINSGTVLGNTIMYNGNFGIQTSSIVGYGNNTLDGNSGGHTSGNPTPLFPNACATGTC